MIHSTYDLNKAAERRRCSMLGVDEIYIEEDITQSPIAIIDGQSFYPIIVRWRIGEQKAMLQIPEAFIEFDSVQYGSFLFSGIRYEINEQKIIEYVKTKIDQFH